MAKESGPSTALLVLLATAGLLSASYGGRRAPGGLAALRTGRSGRSDPHDTTPGQEKAAVKGSRAGADARSPGQIPPRGLWTVLKRVYVGFMDDRLMTEAAGMTFYGLLAIFPALGTLVSLYGLVADPATVNDQLRGLESMIPGGGVDIISQQVKALTSNGSQALGFGVLIGVLTSLWSSNQGIKGLFDALNVVYHEREKRSYLWRTVLTLGFTLGTLVFIMLAMAAVVVVPIVLNFIGLEKDWAAVLLSLGRWPVLLVLIALYLALVYRFGPSRNHAKWQWVSWGSAFAAIAWVLASYGFSYYVQNFGSYNKTYGSLGAAVGFMTWIWISSMIVLLGGELNAELEQQTEQDTTVGPPKPIGTRGAYKADVKV